MIERLIASNRTLFALVTVGIILYAGWTYYVISLNQPMDYYVYYLAADGFLDGKNVYALTRAEFHAIAIKFGITRHAYPYQYPPLTALINVPFTRLSPPVAALIWTIGTPIIALLNAYIFSRETADKFKKAMILTFTIGFFPVLRTMSMGQINLYVILFLSLSLLALQYKKEYLAGIALAITILLKPYALGWIPFLIWRQKWRVLIGFLGGFIGLLALCALVLGMDSVTGQLGPMLDLTTPSNPFRTVPMNQSLNAVIGRMVEAGRFNETVGRTIWYASLATVALICLIIFYPPGRNDKRLPYELCLVLLATHLMPQTTWTHHFTTLIPCIYLLTLNWRFSKRSLFWTVIIILIAFAIHAIFWRELWTISAALTNFPLICVLLVAILLLYHAHANDVPPKERRSSN